MMMNIKNIVLMIVVTMPLCMRSMVGEGHEEALTVHYPSQAQIKVVPTAAEIAVKSAADIEPKSGSEKSGQSQGWGEWTSSWVVSAKDKVFSVGSTLGEVAHALADALIDSEDPDKKEKAEHNFENQVRKEYTDLSPEQIEQVINQSKIELDQEIASKAQTPEIKKEEESYFISNLTNGILSVVEGAKSLAADASKLADQFGGVHEEKDENHNPSDLVADQNGQDFAKEDAARQEENVQEAQVDAAIDKILQGYVKQLQDMFEKATPVDSEQVTDLAQDIVKHLDSKLSQNDQNNLQNMVKIDIEQSLSNDTLQNSTFIAKKIRQIYANIKDWMYQKRTGNKRVTTCLSDGSYLQEIYSKENSNQIDRAFEFKSADEQIETLYVGGKLSRKIVTDATSKTDSYYNFAGKVRIAIKYDVTGKTMQELIFYQPDGTTLQQTISFDAQSNIAVQNYDATGKEVAPAKEEKDEKMISEEFGAKAEVNPTVAQGPLLSPDALADYIYEVEIPKLNYFIKLAVTSVLGSKENLIVSLQALIGKYRLSSDSDIAQKLTEIYNAGNNKKIKPEDYEIEKKLIAIPQATMQNILKSFIKASNAPESEYAKLAASNPFQEQ